MEYVSARDPDRAIYNNTRRFVLNKSNPFFFSGSAASGIGSPHTPQGSIWPMSLILEGTSISRCWQCHGAPVYMSSRCAGLTTNDEEYILRILRTLCDTDAGTNFMHESFHASNPSRFTRSHFAWANSLFSGAAYFACGCARGYCGVVCVCLLGAR